MVAYKIIEDLEDEELSALTENDMIFQALVGFKDAQHDGVPDAVKALNEAGVRTIMVTGDNY